jgi:hypothetical protein
MLHPFSQHFIFFITYEGLNKLERFLLISLSSLVKYNTGLLIILISYKENEVMWIWLQEAYSWHFIFSITNEWAH